MVVVVTMMMMMMMMMIPILVTEVGIVSVVSPVDAKAYAASVGGVSVKYYRWY